MHELKRSTPDQKQFLQDFTTNRKMRQHHELHRSKLMKWILLWTKSMENIAMLKEYDGPPGFSFQKFESHVPLLSYSLRNQSNSIPYMESIQMTHHCMPNSNIKGTLYLYPSGLSVTNTK